MLFWIWMVAWAQQRNGSQHEQCTWRDLWKSVPLEEQLGCAVNLPEWKQFRQVFRLARMAERSDPRTLVYLNEAVRLMASVPKARTKNPGRVGLCNVGIIAGYDFLNRALPLLNLDFPQVRYRLTQLALIWIFTLRNANKIPPELGERWATDDRRIINTIMGLRTVYESQARRAQIIIEQRTKRQIDPAFRDSALRIAVVSICAYPPDSPLALKDVTPQNREKYCDRHGYSLRLHMEPPIIGGDIQIQHAKLATVSYYLKSGDFDWVVWLDCDSIIMNMDKTLDSIIYKAIAEWEPDISGMWQDSWNAEQPIEIEVLDSAQNIRATGNQIGVVYGRFSSTWVVEFDFSFDGLLEGTLSEMSDIIRWKNGAEWVRVKDSLKPCFDRTCKSLLGLKPDKDLLITEEGWGLSSANWLIRRSAWSIEFLDRALLVAHTEQKLFGDQDAIIYLLMNSQVLSNVFDLTFVEDISTLDPLMDPLDSHCVIIPVRELNAYDQLNAWTMGIDGYQIGDLLITFPQCKDPLSCNPLFHVAERFTDDPDELYAEQVKFGATWDYLRVFGPMETVTRLWLKEKGEG